MGNFFSRRVGDSAVYAEIAELDELYHYVRKKARTQTKENMYVIAIASRSPRQFLGLTASFDKSPETIENFVWDSQHAGEYFSDGYLGYRNVLYPGSFTQNIRSKDDTYTVEGVNADLRTYVPMLQRRSRCFPRKLENLNAVLKLFAYAYNLFGQWKLKNKIPVKHKSENPNKKLRKFRYPRLSHLDFIHVH